jgi:phage shock protein C
MIAGVCGGLGQYFGVDPVIIRLIFVVIAVTTFITPLIYPVLWLVMPDAGASPPPATNAQVGVSMPLPPGARFDPLTGQPLPAATAARKAPFTDPDAPASANPPQSNRSRLLGFLLMGIGGIILFNNVGDAFERIFGIDLAGIIFPILLVGLGIYLLRRRTT